MWGLWHENSEAVLLIWPHSYNLTTESMYTCTKILIEFFKQKSSAVGESAPELLSPETYTET